MLPTSHQHQWTSRTSTTSLRSLHSIQWTSASRTSSSGTSGRPLHRTDTKIGYTVLNEKEYQHLWDNDEIKLTNVDIAMTHGYPNLYQHIHLHQQATDAINFKVTSCILLGSNDKIDINWKEDYLGQKTYLVAIAIQVDEPRTRKSYDHTIETAVNIKSSNSTSRHLHTTSCAIHRQRPCDTSWTNVPVRLRQGQPSWHRVIPSLRPDGLLTLTHIHSSVYVHMIQSGAKHIVTSRCTFLI